MKVILGNILTFQNNEIVYLQKHAIAWENDKILEIIPEKAALSKYSQEEVEVLEDHLILPGFIDCHLHYPQFEMIGCYGEELLGWLNKYTFPEETSFKDTSKAKMVAHKLIDEMYTNGTTTGAIYSSSSFEATKTLFSVAKEKGIRAMIGKVAMDRNCPLELVVKPEDEYRQTEKLIKLFHQQTPLLEYVITPRFAPTSTVELLETLKKLKKKYPFLFIQTHFAETKAEIEWVRELFPENKSYLDVYDSYGLLDDKTLLGHCIHLTQDDYQTIKEKNVKIVHCPSSNLFLGSGLFDYPKTEKNGINVGIGSDIGAGTSLNIWKNLLNAYEIQKLRGNYISPSELFRLATLSSAKILGKEKLIGSIEKGKKVDLQILNPNYNDYLSQRFKNHKLTIDEIVFSLINFADDRIVDRCYVNGKEVWKRKVKK